MLARALSIGCAPLLVVALAGCDNHSGHFVGGSTPTLAPVVDTFIQPQIIPLTPVFGFGCPLLPPFTTAFDIVVSERAGVDLFLERVDLRFLDGTHLDGSSVVIPQPEISRLFPSTLIRGLSSRSFRFTPLFGCGIGVPQSLFADLLFLDRFNRRHRSMLQVAIR